MENGMPILSLLPAALSGEESPSIARKRMGTVQVSIGRMDDARVRHWTPIDFRIIFAALQQTTS
jgi:hypothetical protein